jgi:transposase
VLGIQAANKYRVAVAARCHACEPCARLFVTNCRTHFLHAHLSHVAELKEFIGNIKRAERRMKLKFDKQTFESKLGQRRRVGDIQSELTLAAFDWDLVCAGNRLAITSPPSASDGARVVKRMFLGMTIIDVHSFPNFAAG